MLLVLDVGNTTTVIGIYDGETLVKHWRLMSERHTSDELGIYLLNLLDICGIPRASIDGAIRALSGGRAWLDLTRLDD